MRVYPFKHLCKQLSFVRLAVVSHVGGCFICLLVDVQLLFFYLSVFTIEFSVCFLP